MELKNSMKKPKKESKLGRSMMAHLLVRLVVLAVAVTAFSTSIAFLVYYNYYVSNAEECARMIRLVAEENRLKNEESYEQRVDMLRDFCDKAQTVFNEIDGVLIVRPGDTGYEILIRGETEVEFEDDDPEDDDEKRTYREFQPALEGNTVPYRDANEKERMLQIIADLNGDSSKSEAVRRLDWYHGIMVELVEPICIDPDRKQKDLVVVTCSLNHVISGMQKMLMSLLCFLGAGAAIMVGTTMLEFTKRVVKPIKGLNQSVDAYEHGAFVIDPDIFPQKDEFYHLSKSFEEMAKRVETYTEEVRKITSERQKIEAELSMAAQIQQGLLPENFDHFSENRGISLYGCMIPAREVGGDFYDFFDVDSDHIGLVIGDVSGKGMPAALYMATCRALLRDNLQEGLPVDEAVRDTNLQLLQNEVVEMFVTMWIGLYEISTGRLQYVNAGHEYTAVKSGGKDYELQLEDHDIVCGLMEEAGYTLREMRLLPGDRLFLYSDGLAEAMNPKEEQYGTDRMIRALNEAGDRNCEETVRFMQEQLSAFESGAERHDDLTMLSFYRNQ